MADGVSYPPASPFGTMRTLWQLIGANMNSTADQAFAQQFGFANYNIRGITVTQASGALSGTIGGVYLAAAKTTPIVAATQVFTGVTGALSVVDLTINATGSNLLTSQTMFLSLTTALGSAGTANIFVWGIALS